MKLKIILVAVLSVIFILAGCQHESQPTQSTSNQSDLGAQSFSKKPKPPQGPNTEMITFDGDLTGSQEVLGCCPNAGPFPDYTMTLSGGLPAGTHDGNIFMNVFGMGKNKSYMVQFWWTETDDYFIEIRGGVFQEDRKTKTLTAMFTAAPCEIYINNVYSSTVAVSFALSREPAP